MNSAALALKSILDVVATANPTIAEGEQIALGAVTLYRTIRDEIGAPPDMLTDAELAAELSQRGFQLKVENDHWLASHGFPVKDV